MFSPQPAKTLYPAPSAAHGSVVFAPCVCVCGITKKKRISEKGKKKTKQEKKQIITSHHPTVPPPAAMDAAPPAPPPPGLVQIRSPLGLILARSACQSLTTCAGKKGRKDVRVSQG